MENKKPAHRQAKMDLLKGLRSMAMKMIHEGSGEEMPEHMEKVMVAAKDKEGLEKGLDKAKEIVSGSDEESDESSEMDSEMSDEESPEAIQAQIEALQAKLKKHNS